jgi:phage baseplate assembly protein W
MTAARRSGWRFSGIELAGAASGSVRPEGIALTPAGRIALTLGDEAVRQSIILLLTTIPGERVMRPDYGCPLHRLVFAPNDATTAGLAIHYVRQALMRFEPRIDIVSLDAGPVPSRRDADSETQDEERETVRDDDSRLVISLQYRVRATNRAASLELELGLDGPGAA